MDRYYKKVREEKALWQGDPPKKDEKWIETSDPNLWKVIAFFVVLVLFGIAFGITRIPAVDNKELICLPILGIMIVLLILFIIHYMKKLRRIN